MTLRLAAGHRAHGEPRRPAVVHLGPELALLLIVVGAGAVLALWWRDTPTVHGLGDWLTNAGRITGLLAGYTIAVILALMARVPLLERGLGTDRLTRWHAMGGRYTISLVVAHTVLIIWGYAVTANTNVFSQTASLITTYPDILMATVAVGLLVAVGVSSARAIRRRLRYETWHFVHLYTYVAVALAFSHQFATGADFVDNPRARWLWSGLYIGVGALLLWYRLLVPIFGAFHHRLRVLAVEAESGGAVSIYLTGRFLEEMGAQPGQFFRWRFLTRQLWWAANPYSLSAPPRPDRMRITVKDAGGHSAALHDLRPGTRVLAEGPYGAFTALRRRRRKVLLVAGGVGITPLRSLFETLPGGPGDITLIYRARTADELILARELDDIARARGAAVHYLMGGRSAGGRAALAPERLRELVPDLANHDVFICGPEAMMRSTARSLRQSGVSRRSIHFESFAF